jgi:hypothetical protein
MLPEISHVIESISLQVGAAGRNVGQGGFRQQLRR